MHMKRSDDKVVTARVDRNGVQTRLICEKPLSASFSLFQPLSASEEIIEIVCSISCNRFAMGIVVFRGSEA